MGKVYLNPVFYRILEKAGWDMRPYEIYPTLLMFND